MNTVAGLTGIGLVTLVLFTSSVTVKLDPLEDRRADARRQAAERYAKACGLDAKDLEADPVFNGRLFTRVGPSAHLAELKKKKAATMAKSD
jgi:hypothetical protein